MRRQRPSLHGHRRHTVAGGVRPVSLPVNLAVPSATAAAAMALGAPQTEPIPVPSQKANYQQVSTNN